eukprot:353842-Chlamydomonas_euryale.AAC.11
MEGCTVVKAAALELLSICRLYETTNTTSDNRRGCAKPNHLEAGCCLKAPNRHTSCSSNKLAAPPCCRRWTLSVDIVVGHCCLTPACKMLVRRARQAMTCGTPGGRKLRKCLARSTVCVAPKPDQIVEECRCSQACLPNILAVCGCLRTCSAALSQNSPVPAAVA